MTGLKREIMLLAKVAAAYTGAIIGAGFASGQEIMQFFILHGQSGLWGAVLAAVLFSCLGGLIMYLCVKLQTANYRDFMCYLLGPRAGRAMDVVILAMLQGGLCVMLAGGAAVFAEQLGLPARVGAWVILGITMLVLLGGLDGVLTAAVFLVPVKFLAVVAVCLAAIWGSVPPGMPATGEPLFGAGVAGHWLPAVILYVSNNMVFTLAILSSLGRAVPLKLGVSGAFLGGLALGLALILMTLAGLAHLPQAAGYQVPMLYLAGSLGVKFRFLVGGLIFLAILTTAITEAHGVASRMAPAGGLNYRLYGVGACLLALPLSGIGFAGLVRTLYPLFGYAGLIFLAALAYNILAKICRKR